MSLPVILISVYVLTRLMGHYYLDPKYRNLEAAKSRGKRISFYFLVTGKIAGYITIGHTAFEHAPLGSILATIFFIIVLFRSGLSAVFKIKEDFLFWSAILIAFLLMLMWII